MPRRGFRFGKPHRGPGESLDNAPASHIHQILELLAARGFNPQSTAVRPMSERGRRAEIFKITQESPQTNGSHQNLCLKAYFGTPVHAPDAERQGLKEFRSIQQANYKVSGVPRPVEYIAEIDGILMELVEGLNLRRYLTRMLAIPRFPRSKRASQAILGHIGRWLRDFQMATTDQTTQISLGEIAAFECEFLKPGATPLDNTAVEKLRGLLADNAGLKLKTFNAHGDFKAAHQFVKGARSPGSLYLIDWGRSRRCHRFHDLHSMTVNILSWSSVPGVSVSKAREFGAAVERGYFGGEPDRDKSYWLTRAIRLVHVVARPSQWPHSRFARRATIAKWLRVANSEFGHCLSNAQNS